MACNIRLHSLSGVVDFDRASPYVGLGFGTMSKSGLRFSFDLGVLYQKPTAQLAVVCGSGLNAFECAQLQADVAAEEVQLNNEIDDYRFYPVVTLGIGWVF